MKHLITTTALALIMAGPAIGQTPDGQAGGQTGITAGDRDTGTGIGTGTGTGQMDAMQQGDILASELLGSPIYAPAQAQQQDQQAEQDQQGSRWGQSMEADQLQAMQNIGNVNDLVIDEQGTIQAVLVDVGEFTGTDNRQVAIGLNELNFIADSGDPALFYLVTMTGADMLGDAPEFDMTPQQDRGMQQQDGVQQQDTQQPLQDGTQQDQTGMQQDDWRGGREGLAAPDVQREGYAQAQANELSVDDMLNANLYDVNDDNVGNVTDVVLGSEGEAQYIIADVGGFLGLGAHTVAIGFDELSIMRDDNMTDLRLYVDVDEESLRAMPEYTGN